MATPPLCFDGVPAGAGSWEAAPPRYVYNASYDAHEAGRALRDWALPCLLAATRHAAFEANGNASTLHQGRPPQPAPASLQWQPHGCRLQRPDPHGACRRLRHKTLMLVGDSTTSQVFGSLGAARPRIEP